MSADVVNLGYAINVIEDPQQPQPVIRKARELCRTVLTVAAQLEFAVPDKIHVVHGDKTFAFGTLLRPT